RSNFSFLYQLTVGLECLFQRRLRIILMRLVKIYVVTLESAQRVFCGAHDVVSRKSLFVWSHLHSNFGGNDDLLPFSTPLQPVPAHRFGLSPAITPNPRGKRAAISTGLKPAGTNALSN